MTAEASLVASSSSICADDGVVLVSNPSSPNLERQRRPGKKHLPKEAYGILKDYFFNVNRWPKKHERLELAAKVHTVPGSEGYTPKNIEGYFANLRKQHRQTSDVVVKRELVEAPLPLDADETAVNGATIAEGLSSISTAPKKKRKSRATHVGESQATTSATSAQHPLSTASTEASFSGLVASTHMGSPPSASSVPSAKTNQKKRNRIKVEGYKIINDFFTNVSRYPTASQKVELLAAVTSIKGCEGYTLEKLRGYFSRRRTERKEPVPFVKAESPESLSNAALYQDQGSPEAASLVVYPSESLSLSEPEPAREPDARPVSQAFHTSSVLFLPPRVPPPHPPTPPATQLSPFILFSNFEPYTPTLEAQPQPNNSPQPTASDLATTHIRAPEPDSPRYPPDTPIVQPSSSVGSDAAPANAPATPDVVETVETSSAFRGPSDPIPRPSPKSTTKPKSKSHKRALTDGALKVLDDYYANVTPNPSPSQCATLAAQVGALPECGCCTAKQVRKYFKKRRVEERCEALKAERMGAGVDAEVGQAEPVLVLVAVVEPKPNLKSDESVHEMSNINAVASDLAEASTPSLPALGGGRQENSEQLIEDISMDENHKPEDVVLDCPMSDQDGDCSDDHTLIPGKEEGMDAGVDPELVAEVEPNSNSKPDESGPEMSDVIVFTGDLVDASASSLPAFGGQDKDSSHQAVPDISMDDVPEICEPEDVVLDYPNSDDDGECSDAHTQIPGKEERIGAGIEAAHVGHAERDSKLVGEVERHSNSNSDESVCEVVSDALDTDLSQASPSSLPALGGEDECTSDEALPEVSMDDVHEYLKLEDAVLDSSGADQLEDDTPMDVDSDVAPAAVQVDVLGLATQLQRVFSKPATLDEGHPTTFADFAMWLQMRNVGLLCASG